MRIEDLRPAPGSTRRSASASGRGPGSGHGKTPGKGHKGQKARSGGRIHRWFEGGQMPLQRRLPKRGFMPYGRRTEYEIVNLEDVAAGFGAGSVVTRKARCQERLIKKPAVAPSSCSVTARSAAPSPCARTRSASRRRRRSRPRAAASRCLRLAWSRSLAELPEHLPDPGAEAAGAVHARHVRRLPPRCPRPDAGDRRRRALAVLRPGAGHPARAVRPVRRRQSPPRHGLRAGHHAVHHRLDHPAAADAWSCRTSRASQGRRRGPEEDHPVHPLRHWCCR